MNEADGESGESLGPLKSCDWAELMTDENEESGALRLRESHMHIAFYAAKDVDYWRAMYRRAPRVLGP